MKKSPLRVLDYTAKKGWNIEKLAEYERQITSVIRFMEMKGEPLTIEYVDDNQNVVKTLEIEGNKKKALEHQTRMKKLLKGV